MSDILKKDFRELLFNTAKNCTEEELLTALFPIEGNLFKSNKELMVVGRAVNTWGSEKDNMWWKKNKLSDKIANNIIKYSKEINGKCSMKWVTDHWDKNSEESKKDGYYMSCRAFWRVTKNILRELQITQSEDNWSSYLLWTDLYKISYKEGGNPSNSLMKVQFDACASFLEKEIKYFKPLRILFLCGYDWFKDFEEIGFIGKRYSTNVEWKGKFGNSKIVVAKHPQGKNESEFVEQVSRAFITL